jgi:hypothetical protein
MDYWSYAAEQDDVLKELVRSLNPEAGKVLDEDGYLNRYQVLQQ